MCDSGPAIVQMLIIVIGVVYWFFVTDWSLSFDHHHREFRSPVAKWQLALYGGHLAACQWAHVIAKYCGHPDCQKMYGKYVWFYRKFPEKNVWKCMVVTIFDQ